jgi:predicted phosphodiesterase
VSLLLLAIVAYAPPFLQKVLAASDTHIVAAGDWGCSSNTEKTVNNAKSMNPQLLLALGDYSYEKTSTCWLDLIKPVDSITKINFGNHDDDKDSLVNSYLTHFGLSKPYYSFDIHNVHVLTMATEEKFGTDSEQYSFVVNDLRKAANNPDIKWIIVTMHYPFYSSPNTCKESDCAGNKESRELFHPLFDKYGVDLVLQGHVHNYERSLPLKFNQESSSEPIVTSNAKTDYENPEGVIFAIVGTGGVNLHGLSDSAPFMAYQQDSKFGILDMHISDDKLDAKFVTNDGATLDHFSISKTVKKKIIERISDNIVTDTKSKEVSDKVDTKAKPLSDKVDTKAKPLSDKVDTKAKPLIEKDENGKPTITYKLNDDAATDTKAKPLSEEKDTKAKPLSEQKVQEDKPTITYKLNDDAATDTKAKAVSDKKDTKAKPLSEQKVQEDKPSVTKEISKDELTDDKPKSLGNENKADLSSSDKSTDDKSNVRGLIGPSDNSEPIDNDKNDHHGEKSTSTNEKDPFSSLN